MERDEFLKSLGLGMALVCTGACFAGCGSSGGDDETPVPTPPPGGSSVDLNTRLLAVGDQFKVGTVLFVRIAAGNAATSFFATEATCPHQGGALQWKTDRNIVQCQLHFAEYRQDGTVIQGPQNSSGATRTLKLFPVTVTGTTLTATA